ncbi:MAG TPA: hypothetical protein PK847_12585 [Candidatus Sumerlaeota bacterium]|nr:hypothetical protein [Candidatus Sumerlaeota bacterium]HOR29547.1 hypothetical protein [Candidatus Sumerlaeota bacterium]
MTLIDEVGGPDGDLLGLYRVLGAGGDGPANDPLRRELALRLADPKTLHRCLARRFEQGFRAVVVWSDKVLFEALGRRHEPDLPRVIPIVPNLQGFMREAVEYGMVGAGLRRAWRVGALSMAGMGLRGIGRLGEIKRRDFPTLLGSFIELELADFRRYQPPLVLLQPQMTDLALAMHNPRILEAFARTVAERTGAAPGYITCNFATLMASFKAWGIEPAAIVAPWHPAGYGMRPDVSACEQAARACPAPIWAERRGALDAPLPAERSHLQKIGLVGVVREDPAVWSLQ